MTDHSPKALPMPSTAPLSPIRLELLQNALASVTDEMFAALTRTAFSGNIKERQTIDPALHAVGQFGTEWDPGTDPSLNANTFPVEDERIPAIAFFKLEMLHGNSASWTSHTCPSSSRRRTRPAITSSSAAQRRCSTSKSSGSRLAACSLIPDWSSASAPNHSRRSGGLSSSTGGQHSSYGGNKPPGSTAGLASPLSDWEDPNRRRPRPPRTGSGRQRQTDVAAPPLAAPTDMVGAHPAPAYTGTAVCTAHTDALGQHVSSSTLFPYENI